MLFRFCADLDAAARRPYTVNRVNSDVVAVSFK